mgnify:CR=1 FL=1
MNQSTIIVDLDGTIAEDRWRRHYVREDIVDFFTRFHAYHSLSGFDQLVNQQLLLPYHNIVICTSRPEHYRTLTEEWLRQKGVRWTQLLMRPKCNHQPSAVLKQQHLQQLLRQGLHIVCCYDDRPDIIKMYKNNEIEAQLVRLP